MISVYLCCEKGPRCPSAMELIGNTMKCNDYWQLHLHQCMGNRRQYSCGLKRSLSKTNNQMNNHISAYKSMCTIIEIMVRCPPRSCCINNIHCQFPDTVSNNMSTRRLTGSPLMKCASHIFSIFTMPYVAAEASLKPHMWSNGYVCSVNGFYAFIKSSDAIASR